jgi:hypothetical protein
MRGIISWPAERPLASEEHCCVSPEGSVVLNTGLDDWAMKQRTILAVGPDAFCVEETFRHLPAARPNTEADSVCLVPGRSVFEEAISSALTR